MSPQRALLWKEGRAAVLRVVAVAGLALLAGLAHLDPEFSPQIGAHLAGVFAAILMGMHLVAGERSRGTLPFLSNLPVRTAWLLGAKYAVGAAGLLVVLTAYWGGVYLGMSVWGDWSRTGQPLQHPLAREVFTEVGYGRMLLLWFLFHLIPYSAAFLSSALSNRPLQAAGTGLLTLIVGFYLLGPALGLSDPGSLFFRVVLENAFHDGLILRPAFDPALLLARAATALLLAGCVLVWTCRTFRSQEGSRPFPWIMGALALVCLIYMYGARWVPPEPEPAEPAARVPHLVGLVPYRAGIVELVVRDRMAMVLLRSGLSIVDVSDSHAPREVGRVEVEGWRFHRLAVSASAAYAWGWNDSAGVAVFDLSQPERPRLQALRLIHPVKPGPTPWLRLTPRLTAWTVREGYLYAGLLGSEFLELHSFDVREGGLPQPVQVLRIEETARHVWNDDEWEMRLEGENAFLTLGHDFVVLDLTDPAAMRELGRTSLRRFGRSSRQYEELMKALHLQVAQLQRAQLPVETAFVVRSRGGPEVHLENEGARSERRQWIYVPQALGSVSLVGDKAHALRHWPRELAVIDISDPGRPMEVDYLPLPRWWDTQEIEEETVSLSVTISGRDDVRRGSVARTGLQPGGQAGDGELVTLSFAKADVFPVDDHLCTILYNNLGIFEMPPTEPSPEGP